MATEVWHACWTVLLTFKDDIYCRAYCCRACSRVNPLVHFAVPVLCKLQYIVWNEMAQSHSIDSVRVGLVCRCDLSLLQTYLAKRRFVLRCEHFLWLFYIILSNAVCIRCR